MAITDTTTADSTSDDADESTPEMTDAETGVSDELLVEEISIDGMCGVY